MNKKLLATMVIALFVVSTLSALSVLSVKAQDGPCAVCGDVTIDIGPTECVARGGTVTIDITAPTITDSLNATTHNYTITVTKPSGGSKYKSFSLDCGEKISYDYGTDFGTTTNVAGTYKVKVWEKYYNATLHSWCQCLVGEESFAVEAELMVDVAVWNCSGTIGENYTYKRCDEVGYIEAWIQYCNGTAMDDVDSTVIATLTPPTGGVAKSEPMYWVRDIDDEWGIWQTNNTQVQGECLYKFEWDDCSGNWTVGVTAKDTEGNNGYGATSLTLSPTTLTVDEFYIGYYPDCDTDNAPKLVVGYNTTEEIPCFWDEYIFTRCEPVFFAAKVGNACGALGPLEEGNVVVTLYTYPYNKTLASPYLNFSETPTKLYTIKLEYQGDEDEDWYQYWTANWTVPANATPVGYPSASWWLEKKESRRETWWWANLTAADEACGDPNEGTSTGWNFTEPGEECVMDGGMGLLPMWVSYNTPDILVVNPEENDNFQRCETINFTVKVRYDCCNTPFTALGGGNVSAILMAECDEEALEETIYLNDTGAHDKDGYEIWKGSYWINVTDPARWVDEDDKIGLNWTILFRAWDDAPEPVNEKTETLTITVGPAEADVKVCAWVDPNVVSEEGGKGFLFVCIKAWVCGKPVNVTEEGTFATVEITLADTGDPVTSIFDSRLPEDDPFHLWNESDTMSWCMNFCVACIAYESPDLLGLWNVTVTVNQTGVCAPNGGDRTVQVPAAYMNEITWINMACPVNPSSSVEDNCSNKIYINQTTTWTRYHGILSFNTTVIDGGLEAKNVKINVYNADDVLVWSGLMTNASNIEDEDKVNYTAAFPTTECLAPGEYIVRTELTYENGTSDNVCCAYRKTGCPACVVRCPALPEDMECVDTGECPDNKILEQDGCNFTAVPEIKLESLTTLTGPYFPNGWVRFDGLVNDGCGNPLEGVCVEIKVKDADGSSFGLLTGESDEDGKVLSVNGGLLELILPQNAKLGTYTWKATLSWPSENCSEEAVYKYRDANDTKFEFSVEQVENSSSFLVYGKLSTVVLLSSNIVYNGSSVDVLINVQDFFAGTPTTATVSGSVTKPDGTEEALTFTPVGTGIYKATYLVPATAAAGTYTVSYALSKPMYMGVSGSTAFSVQLKTPLPTTTTTIPPTTTTTTITPADITGLLYAIAAIAAIAMIAAIVAVVIIARKTR